MEGLAPASAAIDLGLVRRLEDATINSWPSRHLVVDGAWMLRLTPGHPSKRANALSVLDPTDDARIAERLAAMFGHCERLGAPPLARWTPLMPPAVEAELLAKGFAPFDHTRVLRATLDRPGVAETELATDLLTDPPGERSGWADIIVALGGEAARFRDLLAGIFDRIAPPAALSVAHDAAGRPAAATLSVTDGSLSGLFEVVARPDARREGHATRAIRAALAHGRALGATHGWLQVKADNAAAAAAYDRLGFAEIYRYHYLRRD